MLSYKKTLRQTMNIDWWEIDGMQYELNFPYSFE